MKIKRWHIWLGVAISAVFLYLAFRKVDFSLVWEYLKQARWSWVLLGLAFYFFGVLLRAWRWQVLLNPLKHLPVRRLFPVVAIGYMGNNVYPARAGEVLRSVLLKSKDQVDISGSLATIVVERLFDAIVILGLVLLNLRQLTAMPAAADWVRSIQQGPLLGSDVSVIEGDDLWMRTLIDGQVDLFANPRCKVFFELENISNGCAAEAVKPLVIIPDNT